MKYTFVFERISKWLEEQLNALMDMGISGFKFDAGDSIYYEKDGDQQSLLWAKLGEKYPLNEFRVTFKADGMSLLQRLCDKHHSWDESGIKGLIPGSLAQGITGHPFCSPDMIGGGEYLNFWSQASSLDEELFVRHSEIACLMPGMQFSAAPWRVLSEDNFKEIQATLATRAKYEGELIVGDGTTKVLSGMLGRPIVLERQ